MVGGGGGDGQMRWGTLPGAPVTTFVVSSLDQAPNLRLPSRLRISPPSGWEKLKRGPLASILMPHGGGVVGGGDYLHEDIPKTAH